MSDLFDDEENELMDSLYHPEEKVDLSMSERNVDARRRLEKKLEDRMLQKELDDLIK